MSCQIRCVDIIESRNFPRISVKIIFMINFSIKETFKVWMLSFLEGSKYLTLNDHLFNKKTESFKQ